MQNEQCKTGQEFYERVRSLCLQRGVAITTMARQLHLSPSAPQSWREGTLPRSSTLLKIAEYFGLTVEQILGVQPLPQSGTITNSAIVQDVNASTVHITTGKSSKDAPMDEDTAELIRILSSLDKRGRTKLLAYAYELEDNSPCRGGAAQG